jgi:hypothetical protein
MSDSLVEKSRAVREQLLRELGGLDGLCDKLEEMDREREQQQAAHKQPPGQRTSGGKSSRSKPAKGTAAR